MRKIFGCWLLVAGCWFFAGQAKATQFMVVATGCYKDINSVSFDRTYDVNEGRPFTIRLVGIDPNGLANPGGYINLTGFNLPAWMEIVDDVVIDAACPGDCISPCDGPYDPNAARERGWVLRGHPSKFDSGVYLPIIGLVDQAGRSSFAGLRFVVHDRPEEDTETPFLVSGPVSQ
jgi:hypothetical protein